MVDLQRVRYLPKPSNCKVWVRVLGLYSIVQEARSRNRVEILRVSGRPEGANGAPLHVRLGRACMHVLLLG